MSHPQPSTSARLQDVIRDLVARVDDLYGLYLDATEGFKQLCDRMDSIQRQGKAGGPPARLQQEDKWLIVKGNPNSPDCVVLNATTVSEYRARNSSGGRNAVRLAQYFIVLLFHIWEQEYRPLIASVLSVPQEDIVVPLFGDVRLLRNDILKHRGTFTERTTKQHSVVRLPQVTGPITMGPDDIYNLVQDVKMSLDELVMSRTGVDPGFRKIRQIT